MAYALNEEDKNWYEFDDSWVSQVSEESVKSKEAYVLLYQRRAHSREAEIERILGLISEFQDTTSRTSASSAVPSEDDSMQLVPSDEDTEGKTL